MGDTQGVFALPPGQGWRRAGQIECHGMEAVIFLEHWSLGKRYPPAPSFSRGSWLDQSSCAVSGVPVVGTGHTAVGRADHNPPGVGW